MNYKKIVYIFIICCAFFSCSTRDEVVPVDLSAGDNLAVSPKWLAVNNPYAAFRKDPSYDAEITAHGRKNEVFEIKGVHINPFEGTDLDEHTWYKIESGWVPKDSVRIYKNKLQAEYAVSENN